MKKKAKILTFFDNKNIKCLSKVSNKISQKVMEQYEDNPYPRWFSTELEFKPVKRMVFS